MPILETKNLTFVYGEGTPYRRVALDNVDFASHEGETLALIGHTGSGKSTLIQHFNGLLRPSSGQVLFNEKDIWEKPKEIRSVRFQVGLVFQYPEYQLFDETVFKDISFGPRNMGLSEREISERVREAAAFVELDSALLERSPFELSGGQKRRAAIAGVLAMRQRVLVLDEPTAGLDPAGRDRLLRRLREYKRQTGVTMIMVSHSMEEVAASADRVLVMNDARIAMDGPVKEIYARAEELTAIGLAVPQTTRILLALKARGFPVRTDCYTPEDGAKAVLELIKERSGGSG